MNSFKRFRLNFKALFSWRPTMRSYRPYILPTRHGLAFLVALFFLFLMALSYGHSMAFAATFFLTSLLMSSALLTHFNCKDCFVQSLKVPQTTREGEALSVSLEIQNLTKRDKKSLALYKLGTYKLKRSPGVDLSALESKRTSFFLEDLPIGRYVYTDAQLVTSFPLGLFYSWMKFETEGEFYIAPRAVDHIKKEPQIYSAEESERDQEIGLRFQASPEGDFYEHRHFDTKSDSWHRLDWKVYAKRELLLKKSNAAPEKPLWSLDMRQLHFLEQHQAYEQISYWLELCEQTEQRFHLFLKNSKLENLQGREGALKALKALSLEAAKQGNS